MAEHLSNCPCVTCEAVRPVIEHAPSTDTMRVPIRFGQQVPRHRFKVSCSCGESSDWVERSGLAWDWFDWHREQVER